MSGHRQTPGMSQGTIVNDMIISADRYLENPPMRLPPRFSARDLLMSVLSSISRHLYRVLPQATIASLRTMSSQPPTFKPFNLALVQLGQITADKAGQSSDTIES
jgi:hypothetical protein